ncbi:hypothetical protein O6P43_027466 [Quillaja saponaria]|uniref:Uncharacterized protein n=1 Tax=Quillaja saponaria TaxID=32244 RepID=A0AAD7L674_QUISA|nr:hypothetical protein O6P43_027466 [Quillaja saponaria]
MEKFDQNCCDLTTTTIMIFCSHCCQFVETQCSFSVTDCQIGSRSCILCGKVLADVLKTRKTRFLTNRLINKRIRKRKHSKELELQNEN